MCLHDQHNRRDTFCQVLLAAVVDPHPNDDFQRCCKLVSKRTIWCIENSNKSSFILDERNLFQTFLSGLTSFPRHHIGLSQPSLEPFEDASDSSQEDSDESSASAVQVPRHE